MNKLLNNKKYLVIDNLLSKEESIAIEKKLYDPYFPWYLTDIKDEKGNMYTILPEMVKEYINDKNVIDKGQFVHSFLYTQNNKLIENSVNTYIAFQILKNFCKKTNIQNLSVLRVKANLIIDSKSYTKNSYGVPHVDSSETHYVLIYYVNDCDGDTILFNKNKKIFKRISPKKGRALFFKGDTLHAGGHPVNSSTRCVINFNLKIND